MSRNLLPGKYLRCIRHGKKGGRHLLMACGGDFELPTTFPASFAFPKLEFARIQPVRARMANRLNSCEFSYGETTSPVRIARCFRKCQVSNDFFSGRQNVVSQPLAPFDSPISRDGVDSREIFVYNYKVRGKIQRTRPQGVLSVSNRKSRPKTGDVQRAGAARTGRRSATIAGLLFALAVVGCVLVASANTPAPPTRKTYLARGSRVEILSNCSWINGAPNGRVEQFESFSTRHSQSRGASAPRLATRQTDIAPLESAAAPFGYASRPRFAMPEPRALNCILGGVGKTCRSSLTPTCKPAGKPRGTQAEGGGNRHEASPASTLAFGFGFSADACLRPDVDRSSRDVSLFAICYTSEFNPRSSYRRGDLGAPTPLHARRTELVPFVGQGRKEK